MLTKGDLGQIDKIVARRTEEVVVKELTPIKKDIKIMRGDITKMRGDIDVIISLFDREYIDLRKRVDRIEEHLDLPPIAP